MAESQNVSSLPLPPMQYVNNYTDERVKNGTAPKPPTPVSENYNMFGAVFTPDDVIIRSLESQNLRRLHPKVFDHRKELKKINHSILFNFLDMLDVLVVAPGSKKREEKIEDIKLLFIHMHHLINEFRPHQARETLRVMMEVQKRQRLEAAERFQKHLEKVTEILQSCFGSLPDNMGHIDSKIAARMEPQAEEVSKATEGDSAEKQDEANGQKELEVSFYHKDKLMCNLVDSI
ncbi:mediator of RNA polymerase II transcription subunit 7-like [Acanthaster planci]|uniref:Mediator of RNA polymerase II transcription subunit 7 n=1 Tax=Acanthaster planci TaxID=133434 RepID=A0A8B7XVY4_ACAPL|nr:mediator of RNA polymerase II transcription subunit 7-like [Acanthaster planci]XP_022085025.1 mediator of RNA polymerase II transcription subunit 7-like [Acanthaster planci]XP_022085026.1 mediator of RNA polymerase II transcription subunit 7-like [Acanthaster planci]